MAYSQGGLIAATDYNNFVGTSPSSATNTINTVWAVGSGSAGYGQTAVSQVSVSGTVTATQWASLVNTLASMGSQTNTTITSRTAPVAGNTVSILANVNTDLTNVTTNRGNAASAGTEYGTFTGTTSKTTATGSGQTTWTITFTHTVTFASAKIGRASCRERV